jgi:hypothetical protein
LKKAFVILIILSSFQLFRLADFLDSINSNDEIAIVNVGTLTTFSKHHKNPTKTVLQVIEQEEDDDCIDVGFNKFSSFSTNLYSYSPVFSVSNKHFLIHYATSIKGKLPELFILINIFRL